MFNTILQLLKFIWEINIVLAVWSKNSDNLQVPMNTGLSPTCVAWISDEFDQDVSPHSRYRTHNRLLRDKVIAL